MKSSDSLSCSFSVSISSISSLTTLSLSFSFSFSLSLYFPIKSLMLLDLPLNPSLSSPSLISWIFLMYFSASHNLSVRYSFYYFSSKFFFLMSVISWFKWDSLDWNSSLGRICECISMGSAERYSSYSSMH